MMLSEALLVVDKPAGPTSFDVVRKVKKLVGKCKVGHTGSLDPFATGVLILLLGKATKLSNVLLNLDKRYLATLKLGQATDSMDLTGEIVEEKPVGDLSEERINTVLQGFSGTWMQTPPMYSAKKFKGVRLYELARQQIKVPREPVPVELFSLQLKSVDLPYVQFEVHCSKGTYIRSLADELGRRLGSVAHLSALRRLSCGDFGLDRAVGVEQLEQDFESCRRQGWDQYVGFLKSERHLSGVRQSLQSSAHGGNSIKDYKGIEGFSPSRRGSERL